MKNPQLKPMAALACLGLVACGTVDAVKQTTATAGKKVSQFSLADLRPARVGVVEVREKELKELPTGHERALAFENKRRGAFWFFGGPVDFKEPSMPEPGAELDGSLLPPRIE
jgi:hypothetical protein